MNCIQTIHYVFQLRQRFHQVRLNSYFDFLTCFNFFSVTIDPVLIANLTSQIEDLKMFNDIINGLPDIACFADLQPVAAGMLSSANYVLTLQNENFIQSMVNSFGPIIKDLSDQLDICTAAIITTTGL